MKHSENESRSSASRAAQIGIDTARIAGWNRGIWGNPDFKGKFDGENTARAVFKRGATTDHALVLLSPPSRSCTHSPEIATYEPP